jgi:hypothetical protein
MKFIPFLFFALITWLPAHAQTKLVLENSRTGRHKEIKPGSHIRIRFETRYEGAKVRQQGRVLSLTDSTLTYVAPLPKDTVTVALSQIAGIGKYNKWGSVGLAAGTGAAAGLLLGAIESEYDRERVVSNTSLLTILGAMLVHAGLEVLVYPVRKVNGPNAAWRLKAAR